MVSTSEGRSSARTMSMARSRVRSSTARPCWRRATTSSKTRRTVEAWSPSMVIWLPRTWMADPGKAPSTRLSRTSRSPTRSDMRSLPGTLTVTVVDSIVQTQANGSDGHGSQAPRRAGRRPRLTLPTAVDSLPDPVGHPSSLGALGSPSTSSSGGACGPRHPVGPWPRCGQTASSTALRLGRPSPEGRPH